MYRRIHVRSSNNCHLAGQFATRFMANGLRLRFLVSR